MKCLKPISSAVLVLLLMALSQSVWAASFVVDSLTGTAAQNLTAHTGTTGATWAKNGTNATADFIFTTTPDATAIRSTVTANTFYYASGTPATADYDVQADIVPIGTPTAGFIGVMGREDTTAATGYEFGYNKGFGQWRLYRWGSGTATGIGTSVAATLTSGTTYTIKLQMRSNVLTCYVNGTVTITYTDASSISAAGRAGIFTNNTGSNNDTNSYFMRNFSASDPLVGLTSGTLSSTTNAYNNEILAFTAVTGGTQPYSYQLKRAPDAAGVAGTYANQGSALTGQTSSASFTDGTVAASTKYWYQVLATDSAGTPATVTSVGFTVTTPSASPVTAQGITFASIAATTLTANTTVATGGTAPYTYQFQRAPDSAGSAGTYANIGTNTSAVTINDTGLTASTAYWYRVIVTDNVAATSTGTGSTVTTTSAALAAQSVTYTAIAQTTLTVSTTAATGGTAPYNYQFQRAPDSAGSPGTFANIGTNSTAITFNDTGLTAGTSYWYHVIVTDNVAATITGANTNTTTAAAGAVIVAPNDAAWFSSPGNWIITSSKAQAMHSGCYRLITFTGTTATLAVDGTNLTSAGGTTTWVIDGGLLQSASVGSATTALNLTPTALSAGTHTLRLMIRGRDMGHDIWTAANNIGAPRFGNLTIDTGATFSLPALRPKRAIFFGDSITDGHNIYSNAYSSYTSYDGTINFPSILAGFINAEWGQVGWGGQGWGKGGAAGTNIPPFCTSGQHTWDMLDSVNARTMTGLDYVFVMHAHNDNGSTSDANVTADVSLWLTNVRAAVGVNCKIYVLAGCTNQGQAKAAAVKAGFLAYAGTLTQLAALAASGGADAFVGVNDANAFYIDTGALETLGLTGSVSFKTFDGIHPNQAAHADYAAKLTNGIKATQTTTVTKRVGKPGTSGGAGN